ncbi:MAG TPA: protein kinase [Thermoanaerobaculia bacterium]|nr:protein kinase [Thermoanaerobaculia bacterium]
MNLPVGTRLGPYEIVASIGAGGMGEVYRARDTRLDRSVAIKVLPATLAANPALRARFEREARAISGLTHANICTLHDVGQQDGIDYLVMEHLEGESLADRLARGPLPPSQVLRYGADIAQALHHAHRRGITHRDLKPGNVMLTTGGAKLLDFGLAKLASEHVAAPDAKTVAGMSPLTAEGTIVGTLPYMSPEQIEGKELDARSDIFSLGVMLYEMAAGSRPFSGASAAALAASILSSDPPPQPSISPSLDRVIRTALEKEPDQRFQNAQDLARQLRWISEPSATAQPTMTQSATSAAMRPRFPWWAALIVAAIGLGLIGWGVLRRPERSGTRTLRFSIALPAGHTLFRSAEYNSFAISPDGTAIALIAGHEGKRWLFLRSLDSLALRRIDGTEGAMAPFWSPDGAWIAYSTRGKLWKVKLTGGAPQGLCDAGPGVTGTWQGDTILFADLPGGRGVIHRVSAGGGPPAAVTSLNAAEGEGRQMLPHLLPDGRHFLYVVSVNDASERRLMLGSLDSPMRKRIATNVSSAVVAGDRLLYVREGKLLAQPFDAASGATGDPKTIAEDVGYFFMTGRAEFDASPNGVLIYRTNTATGRLLLADRSGAELREMSDAASAPYLFAVAPDGKRAAVTVRARATGLMDIWIYDLARGVRDRVTSDPGIETTPAWSPDGRSLVYSQATGGVPVLVHRALSTGATKTLGGPGAFQMMGGFSPDGSTIYYTAREQRVVGIARMTLDGSQKPQMVIDDPSVSEQDPRVSPDGRWLSFTSDASGTAEVYVQDLASGDRMRISNRGGTLARWRGDARELFYVGGGETIFRATPRAGWHDVEITQLFRMRNAIEGFDVTPDGQQFLLGEGTSSPYDDLIHVATGW